MARSTPGIRVALAGAILAILGCTSGPSATPLASPLAAAALDVRADWVPCHQMGVCVYSAELVGPDGGRSTAPFEIEAGGLARIGPGLPAALRDGEYTVTLVAVMLGDTIQPNGAQTVLGEDARCSTQFTVGPGAPMVSVTGSFLPRICTVSVAEGGNVSVAAGPDRTTLVIEGTRVPCHSIGGCAYLAQLAGQTGESEAAFIWSAQGDRVTPAAGLPHFLDPGEYLLTFESRLMSDVIVPGQDREFAVAARCRTAFEVAGNAEAIRVRVEFGDDACQITVERRPAP